MSVSSTTGLRQLLLVVTALLCGALPDTAVCRDFAVRSAVAYERDGVYYIDADIGYELNRTALEALQSGIALTFEVRIEIERVRRWRPDSEVAQLLQLYELQYHALSDRFIVRNVNSGEQESFLTLNASLQRLGDIDSLPLLDAALLKDRPEYTVRIKAVLDIRSFPGPLRLLSAFFGDWRQASKWYEWRLTP